MAGTAKVVWGALLAVALTLGGCSSWDHFVDQFDRVSLEPLGFAEPSTPHWRQHRFRHHIHAPADQATVQPAAAAVTDTAKVADPIETGSVTPLSQCNTALYLKAATSHEDLKALEDKCRALIVKQSY